MTVILGERVESLNVGVGSGLVISGRKTETAPFENPQRVRHPPALLRMLVKHLKEELYGCAAADYDPRHRPAHRAGAGAHRDLVLGHE